MLLSFFCAGLLSYGLCTDSIDQVTDTLLSVTVAADKGTVASRKDTLSAAKLFSITDILLRSPGLQIGDYGGYAGIKTVSLRGLGSAHTSIYLDGVRLSNLQSGQGDLGMLNTDNIDQAVVDYAGNSIVFNTPRPIFNNSPVAGNLRLSAGSFGTFLPSARLDVRLSDRISLSANASGVISKGDFIYDGGKVRTNNDIRQLKSGLDLFGGDDRSDYHLKAYVNWSERGTPGSVDWPSDDRQEDLNAFIQGRISHRYAPSYLLNVSFKGAYDDIFYTSSYGDSHYGQTELQCNSSHLFQISDSWELSLAANLQWDRLDSDKYTASRLNVLSALVVSYVSNRFLATASLEYDLAYDMDICLRDFLSPSINMKYTVLKGLEIAAFGRRAFRIPVFNELYYVGYGNPDLKPEDAWMTDLGVDFHRSLYPGWTLKFKADAFCNWLTDKITSAPSVEDPNIWRPYNIGKVLSAGFDTLSGLSYSSGDWECSAECKYAYQSALDHTPGSPSAGNQVPYIPRHMAQLCVRISWKGWSLDPQCYWRGGRSDGTGRIEDWSSINMDLSKSISFKDGLSVLFMVSARNLAGIQCEMVSGYPLPGRSLICGTEIRF